MRHENFEIIDINQTAQSDTYVIVTANGQLTLCTETESDTAPYLHKTCEELDFNELRVRDPSVAGRIAHALKRLKRGAQRSP